MKIEKLSDNQIRCTLNRADLAERELKISELAYGSEKARELFRDMMQQASFEFGFEAEDIPLMIEAIPVSSDCIILMITKVEDPEELDTRFSRFAPSHDDDDIDDTDNAEDIEISSLFAKIQELRDSMELSSEELDKLEDIADDTDDDDTDDIIISDKSSDKKADSKDSTTADKAQPNTPVFRVFSFKSINQAAAACSHVYSLLDVSSALYKDTANNTYLLAISEPKCDIDTLNKACHTLSEYGIRVHAQYASECYFKEHFETIIKADAVNVLGKL